MIKLSRRKLAQAVVAAAVKDPARQARLMRQVAAYLIATKRANQADLLMRDITEALAQQQGILAADVTTAFKLDDSSQRAIGLLLRQATGAQKVQLQEHLDPTLIGGVVVRTTRYELDTSIKTQLRHLAAGGSI